MTDTDTVAGLAPANLLGALRARLYDVLAPCLPGRVYAYPPAQPAGPVAPALWIGGHDGGRAVPLHVATFTVWGVVDGASHAGWAMLDELVAAVTGTLGAGGPFNLEGWSTTTLEASPDVELPAVTFDVSGPVATVTFCPTIPYEALSPPEVITP